MTARPVPSAPLSSRPPARRGVAILLVLVSLATATVLAASYLAARDNSASIGMNVAAAAEARWASLSGVDLAVSVLETETDWRTGHVDGVLLDDHPVGGAMVDVSVADRMTEAPPTEKTRDVVIRATATTGGVTQTATAFAVVMPDPVSQAVAVDLREFATFANERLVVADDAAIGRWATSSGAKLAKPVNLGVLSTTAGSVQTSGTARLADAVVWTSDTASSFLVSDGSDARVATRDLPDDRIPVPAAPDPTYEPFGLPELADATCAAGGTVDKVLDGTAAYVDPGVVRIWSIDRDASADDWTIDGTSMIIGLVHAPDAGTVRLNDSSAAYGRVTAPRIELRLDAGLWYDPLLDEGYGYTNPDSMLYGDDGLLRTEVLTVADLSDAELQALADAAGIKVTAVTDEVLEKFGDLLDDGDPKEEEPPSGIATPRPIPVDHALVENGGDVVTWEDRP